jgi:hypothetical protein
MYSHISQWTPSEGFFGNGLDIWKFRNIGEDWKTLSIPANGI